MVLRERMTGRTKIEKLSETDFEEFRKECLRYGRILKDMEWKSLKDEDMRQTVFYINGFIAKYTMKNGEIMECGLSIKENF